MRFSVSAKRMIRRHTGSVAQKKKEMLSLFFAYSVFYALLNRKNGRW